MRFADIEVSLRLTSQEKKVRDARINLMLTDVLPKIARDIRAKKGALYMSAWGYKNFDRDGVSPSCGTTACLAGHATLAKSMRARGLRNAIDLAGSFSFVPYYKVKLLNGRMVIMRGVSALREFFKIGHEQAERVFGSTQGSTVASRRAALKSILADGDQAY